MDYFDSECDLYRKYQQDRKRITKIKKADHKLTANYHATISQPLQKQLNLKRGIKERFLVVL